MRYNLLWHLLALCASVEWQSREKEEKALLTATATNSALTAQEMRTTQLQRTPTPPRATLGGLLARRDSRLRGVPRSCVLPPAAARCYSSWTRPEYRSARAGSGRPRSTGGTPPPAPPACARSATAPSFCAPASPPGTSPPGGAAGVVVGPAAHRFPPGRGAEDSRASSLRVPPGASVSAPVSRLAGRPLIAAEASLPPFRLRGVGGFNRAPEEPLKHGGQGGRFGYGQNWGGRGGRLDSWYFVNSLV